VRLDSVSRSILHAAIKAALENAGSGRGTQVNDIHVALTEVVESATEDEQGLHLAACVLWLFGARAKKS
jgi:hypothetical protein